MSILNRVRDVFIAYHGDDITGTKNKAKELHQFLINNGIEDCYYSPVSCDDGAYGDSNHGNAVFAQKSNLFILVANENIKADTDGRIINSSVLYQEVNAYYNTVFRENGSIGAAVFCCGNLTDSKAEKLHTMFLGKTVYYDYNELLNWIKNMLRNLKSTLLCDKDAELYKEAFSKVINAISKESSNSGIMDTMIAVLRSFVEKKTAEQMPIIIDAADHALAEYTITNKHHIDVAEDWRPLKEALDQCEEEEYKAKLLREQAQREVAYSALVAKAKNGHIIQKGDRILLYSKSSTVMYLLNSIPKAISSTCTLYIARCSAKKNPDEAHEVYMGIKHDKEYEKRIISDANIEYLIKTKKITKVILGACNINYDKENDVLSSFVNTAGTAAIELIADIYSIPTYILCKIKKHKDDKAITERHVLNTELLDIGNNHTIEIQEHELVPRTPMMSFVSENGIDTEPLFGYYKNDIWKDKRDLVCDTSDVIVKHLITEDECSIEPILIEYLRNLSAEDIIDNIPEIKGIDSKNRLVMSRMRGARVFEIFVLLDDIAKNGCERATEIKLMLMKRINDRQYKLNRAISSWHRRENIELAVYPEHKVVELIEQIWRALCIFGFSARLSKENLCKSDVIHDAKELYSDFKIKADTPFRDSTIKNMIIIDPLFEALDNIETNAGYMSCKNKLMEIISNESVDWSNIAIGEFDFSSCVNLTSVYDDYVGLNMHERTYNVNYLEITCSQMSLDEKEEFIVALIVRYLRFGGRKLLYKMLDNDFSKIRFKFDDYRFYFANMRGFINQIIPEYKKYPSLLKFIDVVGDIDLPSIENDIFLTFYPQHGKRPWLGMFS